MSLPLDFYQSIKNRWEQLFKVPTPPQGKEIQPLTILAKEVLLAHPLSCRDLPTQPHSLIKKVLPNGFTLYIDERHNPKTTIPLISIRLVVKAGHLHEKDEELGLAHLVEHCLFQGTKNFTREAIEELFTSLGCHPGIDSNAATSNTSTIYYLDSIPTENNKWKKCIDLFYELCTCPTFPKEYLIKERGIVQNELLRNEGGMYEAGLHIRSLNFENSRYAKLNLNKLSQEILDASDEELQEIVQRFYLKWYHPENMALMLIGDFGDGPFEVKKRNHLIEEIERQFGQIPRSITSVSLADIDSSIDKDMNIVAPWKYMLRTCMFTHSMFDSDIIVLNRRIVDVDERKDESYLHSIACDVHAYFLDEYLEKIRSQKESPLFNWTRTPEQMKFTDSSLNVFQISAIHGSAYKALSLVSREIKKLELYGCTPKRLDSFLKIYRQNRWNFLIDEVNLPFDTVAQDYATNFLRNDVIVSQASHLFRWLLIGRLDLQELNSRVKHRAALMCNFKEQDLSLMLASSSPEKNRLDQIKDVLEDPLLFENIEQPEDVSLDPSWLSTLFDSITHKKATQKKRFDSIDAYSWTFANGVEATYKPIVSETNFTLNFFVPNGLFSLKSFRQKMHISQAISCLNKIGLKDKTFDEFELLKINCGIEMEIIFEADYWNITFTIENFEGLEPALQILHQRISNIESIQSEEFANTWESNLSQRLARHEEFLKTEGGKFNDAWWSIKMEDHPFFKTETSDELKSLTLDEARQSITEFLQQFSTGRLFICGGSVKEEMMTSLVEKYIGSLRPNEEKTTSLPIPVSFTPGKQIISEDGNVPNRLTRYFLHQVTTIRDPQEEMQLLTAQSILMLYLNQKIRNQQQMTYGVEFQIQPFTMFNDWQFGIVLLTSETNQMSELTNEVKKTMHSILELSHEELQKLLDDRKLEYRRNFANQEQNLSFWQSALFQYLIKNYSIDLISKRAEWIVLMNVSDLKKKLHSILVNSDKFKTLELRPKNQSK